MIRSQFVVSVARHVHAAAVVTRIVPVVPSAPTLLLVGEMSYTHGPGGGVGVGVGDGGAGSGAGPGAGDGVGDGAVVPSAGAAACWMVIVCGPTVTLPVRSACDVFRATVNVAVAVRLPFGFAGGAIHEAALVIVHAQPVRVSMATLTSPPFADTAVFAGETV